MHKHILYSLLLLLLPFVHPAQLTFEQSNSIPVSETGDLLEHAWAGGVNSGQLSMMDMDGDGLEDIFLFDRTTQRFMTFLKNGDGIDTDYTLTFDYQDDFPPVRDWVLLRDLNCDGLKDVFTYFPGGIRVWKNVGTADQMEWELEELLLETFYDVGANPYYSNLYVSNQDIPAIADHDGDGDLDIITFEINGSTIQYHTNMAMENGQCDSLDMVLTNQCYGSIGEDAMSPTIYIGDDFIEGEFCSFNVDDPTIRPDEDPSLEIGSRHAGSTICSFDYDGNGKKDLLIGDISSTTMALVSIFENGNGPDTALTVELEFPQEDLPIDMRIFHGAFYEDVDNDGASDLIASPAYAFECEDDQGIWYYKNVGAENDADFDFQTNDFLQGEMIDMGTVAHPVLADVDTDGLIDLIVSNRGRYSDMGEFVDEMRYYRNVGTSTAPSFALESTDFAGVNGLDFGGYPHAGFGDVDGDGDMDMILGTGQGVLLNYENTAGPAVEPIWSSTGVPMEDDEGSMIDIGQQATPDLYDLDGDGLLDLVIGERNGNFNYYQNTGTSSAPDFQLVSNDLGGITTDIDFSTIGYSVPSFFEIDGVTQMVSGMEEGTLFHVNDIDGNIEGMWTVADSTAFGVREGRRSSPSIADLDNDGLLDMVVGNLSGGIGLYMGTDIEIGLEEYTDISAEVTLYPNPAEDELFLRTSADEIISEIRLTDVSGRLVLRSSQQSRRIDISSLNSGIYLMEIRTERGRAVKRFVKD